MTTTTAQPNLFQVIIAEPLSLVAAQPHQALISVASVALMAQFASSGDILHPFVGFVLALGIEWAYLRGLASDSKASTAWGAYLNWSAFLIVVLWGSLWCLTSFGVIEKKPDGMMAALMAAAHVVPIAWLSLCSAMTHRAAMQLQEQRDLAEREADKRRAQERADKENDLQLEIARERAKLDAWKDAQQFKTNLTATQSNQPKRVAQPFAPGQMGCKFCGQSVEFSTASQKGVIVRLGCVECRTKRKENK